MPELDIPLLRLNYSEKDREWILSEIDAVLQSGYLTMGTRVKRFEKRFAEFCGVRWAVGTNSGTSSLEMAFRAIDVRGGAVVMPSNTYMATPLAAIKAGAQVRFVECRWDDLQMDPEDLERKIDKDTKAAVLVHIGGIISPHFERIKGICSAANIPLVEDAAHAHGAEFKGIRAGNLGMAGSFSFYPTKVLTTAEGGMLTTNDEDIYRKAIVMREHGKADHGVNIHIEIGDNWRFSEIHAVLGLHQMDKVREILDERRRLAQKYDSLLKGNPYLELIHVPKSVKPSYYKYIVYLNSHVDRNTLKRRMLEDGVSLTGEVYEYPCHSQPVFSKYPEYLANSPEDSFAVTDEVCRRHICLPLYPGLSEFEVEHVVATLNKHLEVLSK